MAASFQFRFKPEESYSDVDPPRIEAAVRGVAEVERFKIFDDRLSDATFVTLVVVMRTAGAKELEKLKTALTSISRVRAFAVDRSGATVPLDTLPSERIRAAAESDARI